MNTPMFFFPFKKRAPNAAASNEACWTHHLHAEVFEPRLVLAAQPLVELAHHTLLDHTPWGEETPARGNTESHPVCIPTRNGNLIPADRCPGWIGLNDAAHSLEAPHTLTPGEPQDGRLAEASLALIADPTLEIAAIERLFEQLGE